MLLNQGYLIKYSLYIFSSLFNFGSYEKYTLVNCLLKLSNIPLKTF